MRYAKHTVLADSLVSGAYVDLDYLSATGGTGVIGNPWLINIDHAGPGVLFYGAECVSAASAGLVMPMFMYTSRDGDAITASGDQITVSAISASATGMIPLNLASNSVLGWCLSASAEQIAIDNPPQVRVWLTYLGSDSPGGFASIAF